MGDLIYGIDFGGSTIRIGTVDPETGEIVDSVFSRSLIGVTDNKELTDMVVGQMPKHARIGICAAGSVDEENCIVTLSPNSGIKGNITFGQDLRKLGHDVVMTNDMKAAVCAAARFGEGKGYENVLVATYSSGFNCAVARKKQVVTTAEFGHLLYELANDMKCGCGGYSHLETAVSGNGARDRAIKHFKNHRDQRDPQRGNHTILRFALDELMRKTDARSYNVRSYNVYDPNMLANDDKLYERVLESITSKHVYQAFVANPDEHPQKKIREDQIRAIAVSFGMMVSAFNPIGIMVLMGSQTKDWHLLFAPAINKYCNEKFQLPSLAHPDIVRTELPEIGVQGAVAYGLQSSRKD